MYSKHPALSTETFREFCAKGQWFIDSQDSKYVDEALYDAFGQRQVNEFQTETNQYNVILEVDAQQRGKAESLNYFYLRSPLTGEMVPLSAVAKVDEQSVKPFTRSQKVYVQGSRPDILVPSPKVATYDLQPEMSAPEVTDKIVNAIEHHRYDVIVVNYANGDMVGHSGVFDAAVKAVECLDACVGRIVAALDKVGGEALITADHGNVEQMSDDTTGQAHTAHTLVDQNGLAGHLLRLRQAEQLEHSRCNVSQYAAFGSCYGR